MKIEIWSDYPCPFCYMGKRRLESALNQFAHKDQVELQYRSYELAPDAKQGNDGDIHEMLAKKFQMPREQAQEMNYKMAEQASELGLTFNMDQIIPTNSFDAHRLMHYATAQGKMLETVERLLKAYFTDGLDVGDRNTLINIAVELGLSEQDTTAMLASDEYKDTVHSDIERGRQFGVQGVPFYVINEKYGISGAQPTEVFLNALEQIWKEDNPLTLLNTDGDGNVCADGACAVPEQSDK